MDIDTIYTMESLGPGQVAQYPHIQYMNMAGL